MPTLLELGSRSLRLIGALPTGQSLPSEESSDLLEAAKAMLDAWRIERLMVYQIAQASYSWAGGNASRTIGSSGNFDTTRPVRIESAFVTVNSLDEPLTILTTREQYDGIVQKSVSSTIPMWLFYDPGFPLGTLYLYPYPSATLTLKLNTWQALQTFTSIAESLSLPPGYENAIVWNLALELAPEYPHDDAKYAKVARMAPKYKANIKTINMPSMISQVDSALVGRVRGGSILTG